MQNDTYAGVEMGGTKCICILGSGPRDIRAEHVVTTRDPPSTLGEIAEVLQRWSRGAERLRAIGVAAFGPLDLRPGSRSYGRIGATPKLDWQLVDLAGFLTRRLSVPIGFTTDVIGAALAEGRWGGARGLNDYAYVTVGTGVGVGIIAGGAPLIGCHHPELGHARVARAAGDRWPGSCRFHGDCVEGLACGPAIEARSGAAPMDLPPDSPIWDLVAQTLAQLAHLLVVSTAPQRILMGGGVMNGQPQLLARIRSHLVASLNGYLDFPELAAGLESYIMAPGLGSSAGPLGALAVAQSADGAH